ncbi:hypothetical protein HPB48_003188 [Haemaphysalis longicornis]|uniref:Uncharacterized protein n=1 Tax=Haemaphysalis longicornis TaxID=44386 RepID=A0A9J6GT46_HAELO|nr:hypothetical protein HPB48_003188 [Haemaphysalis longicornis]
MTKQLPTAPNLAHSQYADDITLCTTKGIDGEIECTLQTGGDIVSEQTMVIGLSCSPKKSEVLVMR